MAYPPPNHSLALLLIWGTMCNSLPSLISSSSSSYIETFPCLPTFLFMLLALLCCVSFSHLQIRPIDFSNLSSLCQFSCHVSHSHTASCYSFDHVNRQFVRYSIIFEFVDYCTRSGHICSNSQIIRVAHMRSRHTNTQSQMH